MLRIAALTPDQAEAYAREGVTRIPAAIPAGAVESMRQALWRRLEATCGAIRDRPETWTIARPSKLSPRGGEYAEMASPPVRALLDDLLGEWEEPPRWGLPLVAFPTGEPAWDVPHRHWHLDGTVAAGAPSLARLFALLEPSRQGGGGTVYVAGSHRLVCALAERQGRPLSSAEARRLLTNQHPWFAQLAAPGGGEDRIRQFMVDGHDADGVRVHVAEMLGEPGDIILMHPLTLHAPAPNVRSTPRMMLTQFVHRRG